MKRHVKSQWEAPVLASLEIRETAVKGDSGDESGQRVCGPAAGGGAQDKCS